MRHRAVALHLSMKHFSRLARLPKSAILQVEAVVAQIAADSLGRRAAEHWEWDQLYRRRKWTQIRLHWKTSRQRVLFERVRVIWLFVALSTVSVFFNAMFT
jgi:hypothetical protein